MSGGDSPALAAPAVTLEQARALVALAEHGTFSAAARALRKGHSAVLYAVAQLEAQTGLALLDRRGYRHRFTAAGQRVLDQCRRLLAAERELQVLCAELTAGWEPLLRVVFDGVYPAAPLLRAAAKVAAGGVTRVDVSAEFLGGVEAAFVRDEADLMIAVLPPSMPGLSASPLPPLRLHLCAHAAHPLTRAGGRRGQGELASHVLLTVRGSDPRLELPTAAIEQRATFRLNDFHAKRAAILDGLGFGWLPEPLCADDLASGRLRRVKWRGPSTHTLTPRLYHRADRPLGRAARLVRDGL